MAEYIERETCLEKVCKACNMQFGDYAPCEPNECFMREKLMAIPTAEVEPVRHGRYLRTGWTTSCECVTEIQCSECEETYLFDEIRLETSAQYCPYCGVKWDGGADNG